jgi:predicted phage terminase large subunit-like protein
MEITDRIDTRARLLGSLLAFTQVFYKLRTGREFDLSQPISRESHHITICKALTQAFNEELLKLIINIAPRYGKTELLIHFVAWALAHYPDSQFIYTSYSHSLAKKQTQTIRSIMQLPIYKYLFNVGISEATSAKDNFETTQGGCVYAAGAAGTITGRGAGIQQVDRFGGAIIIDDIHKPDEATSDVIREGVIDWYHNTLKHRVNSPRTPIIFIGQRVHEDDLPAHLLKNTDYSSVILKSLDENNHPLHPQLHDLNALLKIKEESPYVFSAQYQQEPQPAGGGIFKKEWFYLLNEDPDIISTFITVDTAETDKTYNDATVFSFWGIYKIKNYDHETNQYGLHWIDCEELWIEPKDLRLQLMSFYSLCSRYKKKPSFIAIEKKSTGTMLISILKEFRGINIHEVERTSASGSKTSRFLEIQPYIASRKISLPAYGKHTELCIEHCRKITANNSHRFDDIADTMYDAIKIALIDKYINFYSEEQEESTNIVKEMAAHFNQRERMRARILCQR